MNTIIPKDAIDRRLLTLAASKVGQVSAVELSEAVNGILTPAQAKLRVDHLLNDLDTFTVAQQSKLVLIEATNLLQALRDSALNVGVDKQQVTYLATLKFIADRLDANTIKIDDIVTRFSRDHAQFFVNAIYAAFEIVRLELDAHNSGLSDEDADKIITSAVTKGIEAIEAVTIKNG